jgi:hypothetical protein
MDADFDELSGNVELQCTVCIAFSDLYQLKFRAPISKLSQPAPALIFTSRTLRSGGMITLQR